MKPFYPVGQYWVEGQNQALGKTKNGNAQFIIEVMVKGRVNPDNPDEYIKEKPEMTRRAWMVLAESTIDFQMENLRALGFSGDSFGQLDPKHPRAWILKGAMFKMYCNHTQDQNGELREEWSVARSGGGKLAKEEIEDQKVRELDALFADYLKKDKAPPVKAKPKKSNSGEGGVPAHVGAGQPLEIDDSDIPF